MKRSPLADKNNAIHHIRGTDIKVYSGSTTFIYYWWSQYIEPISYTANVFTIMTKLNLMSGKFWHTTMSGGDYSSIRVRIE